MSPLFSLKYLTIILVILLFGSSAYFIRKPNKSQGINALFSSAQILSPAPSPETSPSPSPKIPADYLNSHKPKSSPNFSTYIYPDSKTVKSSAGLLVLESLDNPDKITDWYKEKIKSQGMKTTSFVVTRVNGNVLNKLAGSDGKTNIHITVTKTQNQDKVSIEISPKDQNFQETLIEN